MLEMCLAQVNCCKFMATLLHHLVYVIIRVLWPCVYSLPVPGTGTGANWLKDKNVKWMINFKRVLVYLANRVRRVSCRVTSQSSEAKI